MKREWAAKARPCSNTPFPLAEVVAWPTRGISAGGPPLAPQCTESVPIGAPPAPILPGPDQKAPALLPSSGQPLFSFGCYPRAPIADRFGQGLRVFPASLLLSLSPAPWTPPLWEADTIAKERAKCGVPVERIYLSERQG